MDDRRAEVLVVSIIFFVLASVFVALRFVSRIFVVRKVGLHDSLMLLAWLIDLGFSLALFYATHQGLGLHDSRIKPQDRQSLNQASFAFTVLYNPALMAVKTSILVFYLTLTKGESVYRWANYVTLFVVNAAGLALTLVNAFQCDPVSAAVTYPLPSDAKCTDIITLYLCSSPVNIITDLAIFFLPMPILTKMRLPRKQKIILVVTFSFGFFVAIVDVIRIAYLQDAATSRQLALQMLHLQDSNNGDLTWYASLSFMWSVIEVNVSIMCACVPSLKPLVSRLIPKLIRDTDASSVSDDPRYPRSADLPVSPVLTSNANKSSSQSNSRNSAQRDGGVPVDMREFLSAPDSAPRDTEANTTATSTSYMSSTTFFDFVNMRKPASMLKLNNRESIAPIALTTILFFLWGFAYGLLDILNMQFQLIKGLDAWESLALYAVYFGGYLIGPPLVGRTVLKRWGFKSTFITGLGIYACGTLIFWPSAVLSSYAAFAVSNCIVGVGLAVLETAANPFIALCGPLENSEVRLNISQGVQAIGLVVSPLLAKKVLFKRVTDVSSLVDVQWTYLGIALFDVLLAVAFYYLHVPEASNDDLEELANHRRADNLTPGVAGIPVVWCTLALGIFSMFFYVAAQEVLSKSFETLVQVSLPQSQSQQSHLSPFELLIIGRALFATGRFLAAAAQLFLKPRWILLVSYAGCIICSALCMKTTAHTAVVCALLVFLFQSGIFSIIFAIALRGAARHTKSASAALSLAICGGGVFTFAQHAARINFSVPRPGSAAELFPGSGDGGGGDTSSGSGSGPGSGPGSAKDGIYASYGVLLALHCAGAVFPVYLNLFPVVKKQVDPVLGEYLRRPRGRRRHLDSGAGTGHGAGPGHGAGTGPGAYA